MFVLVHVNLKQPTWQHLARREGKLTFSHRTRIQRRKSVPFLEDRATSLHPLLLSLWKLLPMEGVLLPMETPQKVEQHKLCEGCRAATHSLEAGTALWRLPSDHPFAQLKPQTSLTKSFEASFPWTFCAEPHFNVCLQKLNLLGEIYPIRDLSQLGWLWIMSSRIMSSTL